MHSGWSDSEHPRGGDPEEMRRSQSGHGRLFEEVTAWLRHEWRGWQSGQELGEAHSRHMEEQLQRPWGRNEYV